MKLKSRAFGTHIINLPHYRLLCIVPHSYSIFLFNLTKENINAIEQNFKAIWLQYISRDLEISQFRRKFKLFAAFKINHRKKVESNLISSTFSAGWKQWSILFFAQHFRIKISMKVNRNILLISFLPTTIKIAVDTVIWVYFELFIIA